MDIHNSKNDKRIMKYFTLKNKLRYICVQDDEIDKTYIALSVNVGSTINKQYYEGIAHLLEHMCFITSDKYKIKNYLHNKATELGGYTNAYTDNLNTVYYFEIFSENLNEIITIFSDYLFNSDLDKKFILDEMKNVDSEHQKNINNDGFRIFNIEHLLTDPSSEYNSFFTGSLKTLDKPDIREKLLDLYKNYYIPQNISLCVVSNLKINKVNKIIYNNFKHANNNNIKHANNNIKKPMYTNNMNKAFMINSVNKSYIFKYIFESLELNKYINSKVFDYVSLILNTKMKNSLYDFLIINNYITNLYASFEDVEGLFFIIFELTEYGYKNIIKIDGYLRYYIDFILKYNFKNLFDICNLIDKFNYNNTIKEDPMELAKTLAINSFKYDIKNIYKGNFFFLEYNDKHIKDLHKVLNFDKSIQLIITDKFDATKYMTDPNYGTKYKQIKKIISSPIKFNIDLNFNNNYIGNIIIYYDHLKHDIPIQIHKNIWFGNTSKFNEKVNYVGIIFFKKEFYNTPINLIYTNISLEIITFLLKRELHDAIDVNYNFNFSSNIINNEIILNIYLINDKISSQKLIDFILDFILNNNLNLNDKFILQHIKNYKLNTKNIKNMSPWNYVNYIKNLNYTNFYHYEKIIQEFKNISINEFKLYYKQLFTNTKCTTFTFGNIDSNYDFNKINHLLSDKYKFNKMILPKLINVIHPNKKEINNCIKILIKIGSYDNILILHIFLTTLIVKDIFYNILRTDKQLGYLVSFNWLKIDNIYYFSETIQSSHKLNFVYDNIIEFNNNLLEYFKDINFNIWIDNLITQLKFKETSIHKVYLLHLGEILNREFYFNRNKELLKYINEVTKKSLLEFINKYIVKNKNIHIFNVYAPFQSK